MEYPIRHPRTLVPALRAHARRRPSARAALAAGILAGILAFLLLQAFAVVVYDEPFWRLPRMIAAMVRGPAALEPDDDFDAALAAIAVGLWLALSSLYSLALACLIADMPRRYAAWMGIAFGAALYFVNFHGFTALFPWLAPLRTLDTLAVHALFGFVAARGYVALRRRPPRR